MPQPFFATPSELSVIQSAGSKVLTTSGLAEFKRLLAESHRERRAIGRELAVARNTEKAAVGAFKRWNDGWLLRRILISKFERMRAHAEESTALRSELEEQEALSSLRTELDLPESVASRFHRMCDDFSAVKRSAKKWDTVGERKANRVAERTSATRVIERKAVEFHVGACRLIECEWAVPHLENANGGDLYLYPAFVLYFVDEETFALLEYDEITVSFAYTQFIEQEPVPSDSKIVGTTWAKVNRDGSPDRRFKDNYEIPVARYGLLQIRSKTGMNEEYMVSNAEALDSFSSSWLALANAVAATSQ